MYASPRLSTIKMVEETIKNGDSAITLAELKRRLPKQVNHYTLKEIITYLEESRKIYFGSKGMTWLDKFKGEGTKH
jgi:hypothetical protein